MFAKEHTRITLLAPGKVNLHLEVLGRRNNGYHDIRSIVVPIDICDRVTLEPCDAAIETVLSTGVDAEGNDALPSGTGGNVSDVTSPNSLTTKAALALRRATGYGGGARISVEKHIPLGGGLGGGSADAAAALTGLNLLWETGLSKQQLIEIGASIGCDVPALIHGGIVMIEGLGERVSPLFPDGTPPCASWPLVVINPGFRVSTADIYARCTSALTSAERPYKRVVSALEAGDVELGGKALFNGLEGITFAKYPLIEIMVEGLIKAGAAGALMSGSGASVFGLALNVAQAETLRGTVQASLGFPVWSRVTRTLPDGVMAAHGPLEARV